MTTNATKNNAECTILLLLKFYNAIPIMDCTGVHCSEYVERPWRSITNGLHGVAYDWVWGECQSRYHRIILLY